MTLIMQYASLGLLAVQCRIGDLLANACSRKKVERKDFLLRTDKDKMDESDVYQYGYYGALTATLVNAASMYW